LVHRESDNQQVVLKASGSPDMDVVTQYECDMLRKVSTIEHIVRCEASCVPVGGTRSIIVAPFVQHAASARYSVNKLKVQGTRLSEQEKDNAAELTFKTGFEMLKAGVVNLDQAHNILYASDGTPTFIDFGRAVDLQAKKYPAAFDHWCKKAPKDPRKMDIRDFNKKAVHVFLEALVEKAPDSWWDVEAGLEGPPRVISRLLQAPCPPDTDGKCPDEAEWKKELQQLVSEFS